MSETDLSATMEKHLVIIQLILIGGFVFVGALFRFGDFNFIALLGAGLMFVGLLMGANLAQRGEMY